jgi:hypothetical protein
MKRGREWGTQTDTQTDRGVAGEEGGRLTVYRMREDQKRRQPHHTTQHDMIRHTGTTIEIGTGRDETWQGMAMHGDGDGRKERREWGTQTDRQTDTQTEMWRERREGGRLTFYRIERGSEEETATQHNTTQHDTTHRNNDREWGT